MIDWEKEVLARKDELIKDTQKLLQIKSVLDEEQATEDAPLGKGVKEALQFMLDLGEKDGFRVKNVDNLAGHIEFGEGEECVGILCHVDVVPEGDGWTYPPYGAEIHDGKIFARGAIDDKGPTMAAYYGMKIVKEAGLKLNRRVRMIIGTDEESDWRCVDRYFKKEEMPTFGFAPDAEFPIINAEKGISDFDLVQQTSESRKSDRNQVEVISFESGRRYNMVPDFAKATVYCPQKEEEIVGRFSSFLSENSLQGRHAASEGHLTFEIEGISAHGMEPENGKNAGLYLASFLNSFILDKQADAYFSFAVKYFWKDSRGKALGVSYSDDITGDLTINVGKMSYTNDKGGKFGLNLRYPVTNDIAKTREKITAAAENEGFALMNFTNSAPHHVDENDFLIQTLKKVYEERTGEEAELLSIGGGTYARSLKSGVAFGPLFPGRPDIAHHKDEYMIIDDLLKSAEIYAQAIYELAK